MFGAGQALLHETHWWRHIGGDTLVETHWCHPGFLWPKEPWMVPFPLVAPDEFLAGRMMQRIRADFAPATWQAFQRHVLDGIPPLQVAAELNLSLNSVLLAKSRILKRLRQELQGLVD